MLVTSNLRSKKYSLKELLSTQVPLIAASFSDTADDNSLKTAFEDGLDIAELRIDQYGSFEIEYILSQVQRFVDFPTIATVRIESQGGNWKGEDQERLDISKAVLPYVDCVDIELVSQEILADLVTKAKSQDKLVIISHHDFEATPPIEELEQLALQAKDLGADLVKLAVNTNSNDDLRRLSLFTLDKSSLGLIVIAMGQEGRMSRLCFPAFGSRITYAAIGEPVCGQLSFRQTFDWFREFYPSFNEKKNTQRVL